MRADPWFRLGWILLTVSGVFPVAVGIGNYLSFILSVNDSHAGWLTPFGRLGFSFDDLRSFRTDVAGAWVMLNHIGSVNLVMSGVTLVVVSWAGIRRRSRWSWLLVLFGTIWVGANDLLATFIVKLDQAVPVPIAPMALAAAGLALSARGVFSSAPSRATDRETRNA
jgi:hypothetical protein